MRVRGSQRLPVKEHGGAMRFCEVWEKGAMPAAGVAIAKEQY
ncbi:MAG: hypothetical protein V7K32_14200 [Nostoc sp.]